MTIDEMRRHTAKPTGDDPLAVGGEQRFKLLEQSASRLYQQMLRLRAGGSDRRDAMDKWYAAKANRGPKSMLLLARELDEISFAVDEMLWRDSLGHGNVKANEGCGEEEEEEAEHGGRAL